MVSSQWPVVSYKESEIENNGLRTTDKVKGYRSRSVAAAAWLAEASQRRRLSCRKAVKRQKRYENIQIEMRHIFKHLIIRKVA